MPIGVVEIRDAEEPDGRGRSRRVKKPFVQGTNREIGSNAVRLRGWGAIVFGDLAKGLDIEYEEVGQKEVADVRRYAAVPGGVRRLLESHGCDHPGLALDKFVYRSADQSFVKHALQKVADSNNARSADTQWFRDLRNRWMAAMNRGGNPALRCAATGPLTLHLARASALENAGICLHPLYGFAYLPGSGLKGMARAYAETVWLPAQADQKQAWRRIEDVFGWAPNPDRRQQINDPNHPAEVRRKDDHDPESPEIKASTGSIIFHDAWPESWPQLIVDIVNNHHPDYYGAAPDDNDHPPGDWEDPRPVYFLAVKPVTTFTFSLSKRRADMVGELLDHARQWLLGALCHLGAGAKTAAGYGVFKPENEASPALPTRRRAAFETTLELVTPAFPAGASQEKDDCDLRPATLRGLLRWWWRTMHAGFVDVRTLRALEAAIWGDTHISGAVRIVIEEVRREEPRPYDKRTKANFNDQQKQSEHGIPNEDPRKTTQGLWYASYGMDETNRRRHYLEPGARWRLRLIGRPTQFFANRNDASDPRKASLGKPITAEQALHQAKAAVWLLCHFGAIGSKGRKGFGSLTADQIQDYTLEICRDAAKQLRQQLALANGFDERRASSPSVEQLLGPVEVDYSWPNVWIVLDQLGFAYESAAHQRAHDAGKLALGLPRQIHGPRNQPLPHQNATTHRRSQRLRGPKGDRHSSPVHVHVERRDDGWTIRVITFPAAHLPDFNTSRRFLEEFLKDFGDDLRRRSQLSPPPSNPAGGAAPSRSAAAPPSAASPTSVRVRFQGPHGKLKDAFWVQEEGKKRGLLKYGTPPNKRTPPAPLPAVDAEIEVYRTNDNPNAPEYRWDPPPPTNPPRGGPGGKRPRGRR